MMDQDPRRKKTQARLIAVSAAVLVIVAGVWYIHQRPQTLNQIVSFGTTAEQAAVATIKQNVSEPPPLKAAISKITGQDSTLTQEGVIADTNTQRAQNGNLPALMENATLDAIATDRINDMFAHQYFAHVSPAGNSAVTVASSVGYNYIAIGENLAQGNFAGDTGVVDAWMGSPGHRANILNTHYTQIGVAVKEGIFEGEKTWLAVQIFGKPASACPATSDSLKATIEANEAELDQMSSDLAQKKAAIDSAQPQGGSAYDAQIDAYNAEVEQYNALAAQTKTQVATYNAQVTAYNNCIEE